MALLVGLLLASLLAACGAAGGGEGSGANACERAVSAAAAVPAGEASPADLDGAIAVCDDWPTLAAALETWPGAGEGADTRAAVAARCAADPALALSAVCSTLSPGPSPTAPGPSASAPASPADIARITFGTGLNAARTAVVDELTRLRAAYPRPVALLATLAEPVGTDEVTVRVVRGADPAAAAVLERALAVDPQRPVIAAELDLARLLERRAGSYLVRLVAGERVLAEGTIELVG